MVETYKIIFKTESPIHIGYRQIGNLKTTRYYIMGKQMWGAITANLTKALFDNPKSNKYEEVGEFVKEHIKTTYFYPAIEKDKNNYELFLPKYTENGLKIGKLLKDEFEQCFIKSYVSTALEVNTRTAEEGSLHEFEYINNKIYYKGDIYNVYWIGYLIVNENVEKNGIKIENCEDKDVKINGDVSLKDVLNIIQVGGERNYGFGKLKLEEIKKTDKLFNEYNVKKDSNNIILEPINPKNEKTIIAHLHISNIEKDQIKKFYGEIEAFSGMEWENNGNKKEGAGQKISEVKVCLTPGSNILDENIEKFIIGKYGIIHIG